MAYRLLRLPLRLLLLLFLALLEAHEEELSTKRDIQTEALRNRGFRVRQDNAPTLLRAKAIKTLTTPTPSVALQIRPARAIAAMVFMLLRYLTCDEFQELPFPRSRRVAIWDNRDLGVLVEDVGIDIHGSTSLRGLASLWITIIRFNITTTTEGPLWESLPQSFETLEL
ncbi:hypothetical protein BS50DRAFT_593596 [Corynespora cassiicola Philippines]|uniref:Uncharacterized protein n=1 Tax=Corynespora cassiicola Philippines TaxID=1448308 RepID=A0A2T2N637_CORCC|nr:hypothetical protein BS50DRAFT_593596 [Corynespora cassiicola Philippines]